MFLSYFDLLAQYIKIVYILVHCKWGPWNKGQCDKTCGKDSKRINTRKIEVNEAYEKVKNNIIRAAEEYIPTTGKGRRRREVPWWNQDLQDLIKNKHKLEHQIERRKDAIKKLNEKHVSLESKTRGDTLTT